MKLVDGLRLMMVGVAGLIAVSACGQVARAHDDVAKQEKQLRVFLLDASEGGIVEVQLGQLAVARASSPAVKAYAQKMVDEHTKLNATIKTFVLAHKLAPAGGLNSANQEEYSKLQGLTGADFDKEYLTFLLPGKHNELHQYRREAAITTDPSLKAAMSDVVKMIFDASRELDSLAAANGVALPERPPVPMPTR